MKKKGLLIIVVLGCIALIIAIILLFSNNFKLNGKNNIEIIDATYSCSSILEKFYEDDKYIYSFPCIKSKSVFVKFSNGNKMLVVDALNEDKVTIKELLNAGLEVHKIEK